MKICKIFHNLVNEIQIIFAAKVRALHVVFLSQRQSEPNLQLKTTK